MATADIQSGTVPSSEFVTIPHCSASREAACCAAPGKRGHNSPPAKRLDPLEPRACPYQLHL